MEQLNKFMCFFLKGIIIDLYIFKICTKLFQKKIGGKVNNEGMARGKGRQCQFCD